jgi:hypothetical protein
VQQSAGGWAQVWRPLSQDERTFLVNGLTKEVREFCKVNIIEPNWTSQYVSDFFHEVADEVKVAHGCTITGLKQPLKSILDNVNYTFKMPDIKAAIEGISMQDNGAYVIKALIYTFLRKVSMHKKVSTPQIIVDLFNYEFGPNPTSGDSVSAPSSGEEVRFSKGELTKESSSEEDSSSEEEDK